MDDMHDHSLVIHGSCPRLDAVNLRDSLLAALVATIWGFNFVVIDWGMDGVPPLLFAAVRFTAVVFPAVFFVRRPDAPWRTIVAVGAFMSLGQFGFLYVAMDAGMPPGLAALVLQAQVIFTIVIAAGCCASAHRRRRRRASRSARSGSASSHRARRPRPGPRLGAVPARARCRGASATWSRVPRAAPAGCR